MPARRYQLTVKGELSDSTCRAFGPVQVVRTGGTTVLTGPVRDQAELQGMLQRVADLGLTLLSANIVGEGAAGSQAGTEGGAE